MIKTIIFDFGDVFLNLDKTGSLKKILNLLELDSLPEDLIAFNCLYEQGLISTEEFLDFYQNNFPKLNRQQLIETWNYILKDFPKHRLDFLKQLHKDNIYKLILLSNTNELHIDWVKEHTLFYEAFKSYFEVFYLSHEIHLRKPETDIYEFVLKVNNLIATECLFIDDTKENTEAAKELGIHTWNINPETEDIVDLFTIKKELF